MILQTNIAGVDLASYVCNASGPNDVTEKELEVIAGSNSSLIVMKSCTVLPRTGNAFPRYQLMPWGAFQSMGLPNLGYKQYIDIAKKLKQSFANKPIMASVAGLCFQDYIQMVDAFQDSEIDLLEVNLSCPNLKGKPQIAYDWQTTENLLKELDSYKAKPIGLKLPPYYDIVHFDLMANIILKHSVKFISCINSIGNTLFIDADKETTLIKPNQGYGGLCGNYIKPIALANVRMFYERLKNRIDIFGVGGINNGEDAFEFLLAGADGVQVGTLFDREGKDCFDRVCHELEAILIKKKYQSIKAVKGKLKYL